MSKSNPNNSRRRRTWKPPTNNGFFLGNCHDCNEQHTGGGGYHVESTRRRSKDGTPSPLNDFVRRRRKTRKRLSSFLGGRWFRILWCSTMINVSSIPGSFWTGGGFFFFVTGEITTTSPPTTTTTATTDDTNSSGSVSASSSSLSSSSSCLDPQTPPPEENSFLPPPQTKMNSVDKNQIDRLSTDAVGKDDDDKRTNDDDDDDDLHLRRQRQKEACRRNPTWTNTFPTNTGNNDNLQVEEEIINHETCFQVMTTIQNDSLDDDDDDSSFWLMEDWMPQFAVLGSSQQRHPPSTKTVRNDTELPPSKQEAGKGKSEHNSAFTTHWIQWWVESNQHDMLQSCLLKPVDDPSSNITLACRAAANHGQDVDDNLQQDRQFSSGMKATGVYSHSEEGDLVIVENALTECEAAWLEQIVHCMQNQLPMELPFYQARAFGEEEDMDENYGLYKAHGGNYVTYLGGLLPYYLPGVVHSLYQAMTAAYEYAHWDQVETFTQEKNMYAVDPNDIDSTTTQSTAEVSPLPHPQTLGLRSVEYLHYDSNGRVGPHADTESYYTMSLALSHPQDYEGGYFYMGAGSRERNDTSYSDYFSSTSSSGLQVQFKTPRLSAVVFYSEAIHGITPIKQGQRNALAVELWDWHPHVPLGFCRPTSKEYQKFLSYSNENKSE